MNTLEFMKRLKGNALLQEMLNYNEAIYVELCPAIVAKTPPTRTCMAHFAQTRDYFRWLNIYVLPDVYIAMVRIVKECMYAETLSLFTKSYGSRYIDLYEFNAIQKQNVDLVIVFILRQIWE